MAVKSRLKDGVLRLEIPIQKPQPSGSGKTMVVATTHGLVNTGITYRGSEIIVNANAREAGIPDRRIYDLRATMASRANACHASGLTTAQLLGHANSTQILPTYVKPLDENTRAVTNALDAARTSQAGWPSSIH